VSAAPVPWSTRRAAGQPTKKTCSSMRKNVQDMPLCFTKVAASTHKATASWRTEIEPHARAAPQAGFYVVRAESVLSNVTSRDLTRQHHDSSENRGKGKRKVETRRQYCITVPEKIVPRSTWGKHTAPMTKLCSPSIFHSQGAFLSYNIVSISLFICPTVCCVVGVRLKTRPYVA
jgi:hypothetical protein